MKFSFSYTGCQTKAKESSLSEYLLIARGRRDGFRSFLKVFVQSVLYHDKEEMHSEMELIIY